LIFSVLQISEKRFTHEGEPIDCSLPAQGVIVVESLVTLDSSGFWEGKACLKRQINFSTD
jgi:hypothetical protein